jgi:protein involved in polysaccharide export with SLBB domain
VVADFERALEGDSSSDALLEGGDIIVVPRAVGTVRVIGEVVDPGEVEWQPGRRFGHYVRRVGGYSDGAHKGRATVIRRATGERTAAGRAGVLAPGDTVWIPERPPTDWWRVTRDVAALIASVVTAYVVIDQAITN